MSPPRHSGRASSPGFHGEVLHTLQLSYDGSSFPLAGLWFEPKLRFEHPAAPGCSLITSRL